MLRGALLNRNQKVPLVRPDENGGSLLLSLLVASFMVILGL
jgi:hypothetical protein